MGLKNLMNIYIDLSDNVMILDNSSNIELRKIVAEKSVNTALCNRYEHIPKDLLIWSPSTWKEMKRLTNEG